MRDSLTQVERDLNQMYRQRPPDYTAIDIAEERCDDLDTQVYAFRETVASFKKSVQDALCNAAAVTQVYAVNMSTNAKKMINTVSNVPSAQAAVDAAQLAVDAATTADKYATQYSDFVAYIVNTPISPMRGGGGMMGMATSMGGGMSIIDPRALASAKALFAATRAADVHAALQNATNYYNIACAAAINAAQAAAQAAADANTDQATDNTDQAADNTDQATDNTDQAAADANTDQADANTDQADANTDQAAAADDAQPE